MIHVLRLLELEQLPPTAVNAGGVLFAILSFE